jgi:phosphoribosylglycinamide formyltransferase-1
VTAALDGGAIIGQAVVPVLPSDDEHTLADRVLSYEHQLFSRAVKACVEGKIQYVNERAVMDDETALSLTLLAHLEDLNKNGRKNFHGSSFEPASSD